MSMLINFSLLRQMVHKEDFSTVSALGTFKSSVYMIGGPAIGGLLLATQGIVVTYMADVFSFAISLITLSLMSNIPKPLSKRDDSTLTALKTGLRYAFSRQELVDTHVVDFLAMVFGMPMALFPVHYLFLFLVVGPSSITASIVSGGVLCVVGVLGACYFLPKFWQYRSDSDN